MKKFIAKLTTVALIAFVTVPWTSMASWFWATIAWTAALATNTVTVTTTGWENFAAWAYVVSTWSVQITDSANDSSIWGALSNFTAWTGTYSFDVTTPPTSPWIYIVSFRTVWTDTTINTSDDKVVTAMLYLWNANTVTVQATVEPILTLALTWGSVSFWVLDVWVDNHATTTTTWTITTNAIWGYTATVSATNGGLRSTNASYTIAWKNWAHTWEFFDISVAVAAWSSWTSVPTAHANFGSNNGTTDVAITSSSQTISSWNWTTNWDTFSVNYYAWVTAVTPAASDYSTTVTYAVTWTF